jgi:hypothetical protein
LLAGAGALAAVAWGWRGRPVDGRGYYEVARWRIPGGEGRFIATAPAPTIDELRNLAERLRKELSGVNTVVMVFDDAGAAREVRRGSRHIGEERFQAALVRQRAMYVKQAVRGDHRLVVYERYPSAREVVRYRVERRTG